MNFGTWYSNPSDMEERTMNFGIWYLNPSDMGERTMSIGTWYPNPNPFVMREQPAEKVESIFIPFAKLKDYDEFIECRFKTHSRLNKFDLGYIDPQKYKIPKINPGIEDLVEAYFTCDICMDLLYPPITLSCGHTFCVGCINDLKNTKFYYDVSISCPMCRQRCTKFCEPKGIKKFIERHSSVSCCYGCNWDGSTDEYDNHVKKCDLCPVRCLCNEICFRKDYDQHIRTCNFRLVKCIHCNKTGHHKYLKAHIKRCLQKQIINHIKEAGLQSKIDIHNSDHRIRTCKYCLDQILAEKLARHENACKAKHSKTPWKNKKR